MALTTISPALQDTQAQYTGFKNRIINGSMMIDQRNAGASVSYGGGSGYTVDRFSYECSNTAVSLQQVSDAPAGFTKSLKWTTTTGASISAGSYADIQQAVEGYNFADFAYGTASAASMAISFWVKSSITGTYSVNVRLTNGVNSGYVATYTINSASTWEYKTIIVPGNTANAPSSTTNGYSINLYFMLGAGSTYQTSSLNTWGSAGSAGYGQSTTSTNAVYTTTGATWQVTGVQLEKGSTATSFDYRPYGTELALCQRYFWKMNNTADGTPIIFTGVNAGTATAYGSVQLPVTMRANPTASASASNWGYIRNVGSFTLYDTNAVPSTSSIGYGLLTAVYATIATASLTSAAACQVYLYNSAWVSFSAEL